MEIYQVLAALVAAHPWVVNGLIWLTIASYGASMLDSILPQPAPGSHWLPLRKAISVLAWNLFNARNANQPALATWLVRVLVLSLRGLPAGSLTAVAGQVAEALLAAGQPAPAAQAPAVQPVAAPVAAPMT